MLDPALQNYLQQAKAAGASLESVTQQLVQAGWSNEQILEAQAWYSGKPVTQPILNSQTSPQGETPVKQQPSKKRFSLNKKVTFALIGCFLLFLIAGSGVYAYLLAADKAKSDFAFLEDAADWIAVNVPFFPKTPKLVLGQAINSHQTVTQNSMDFSLVATSSDFTNMVGGNELDVQVKGYTDISDPKNPRFDLIGDISKDFQFEIRKNDPLLYFKINKVPTLLLSFFGVDATQLDPILNKWISYDTTPLDTEARKDLQQLDQEVDDNDDFVSSIADKMLADDILPALVMEKEELDGLQTYKINFSPSDEMLDYLGETLDERLASTNHQYTQVLGASTNYLVQDEPKLSDVIKKLSVTMWIDNQDYYVRKISISFNIETPEVDPSAGPSLDALPIPTDTSAPITVVSVLKLSDFGKTIDIETPSSAMTIDEFYQEISRLMFGGSMGTSLITNPEKQFADANNTVRYSDITIILSAIERYMAFEGKLPVGITTATQNISSTGADLCKSLVEEAYEIKALPIDPALQTDKVAVTDCSQPYDTGYQVSVSADGKDVTVSAPLAENGEEVSVP